MELENNVYFWQKLDTLVLSGEVIIDRKKNSSHPTYPNLVYPVDYGYINDTRSQDNEGVDCFVGSGKKEEAQAVIVAVDILKKDIEIKIVLGCTHDEEEAILRFMNQTDFQKTIVVRRGNELPAWSESDN